MDYLKLVNTRYGARNYNGKLVSKSDVEYILKCANTTATALNIQNYAFGVILNPSSFDKLADCTYSQDYIRNAGGFIIVFAKMEGLIGADSKFIAEMFKSHVTDVYSLEFFVNRYKTHFSDKSFKDYSIGQSNFAVTNVVNAAASLGIKSNIIAAFDVDKLIESFNINANNYYPNVIIPLGYNDEAVKPKDRLPLKETIVFMDE